MKWTCIRIQFEDGTEISYYANDWEKMLKAKQALEDLDDAITLAEQLASLAKKELKK